MARKLYAWLQQLGLTRNLTYVAKQTGIDMEALRNFNRSTPKVETLEKMSAFIEKLARSR